MVRRKLGNVTCYWRCRATSKLRAPSSGAKGITSMPTSFLGRLKMRFLLILPMLSLGLALAASPACADPVPCSCLQEMWVDYPGPFDLYFSLDHITSCNDEGEEGLWYGIASNSTLPQICERNECEEYEGQ